MASMCASYNSKCISLFLAPSLLDFNCKVQSEMASLPDSVKEAGCQVQVVACVCVCVCVSVCVCVRWWSDRQRSG